MSKYVVRFFTPLSGVALYATRVGGWSRHQKDAYRFKKKEWAVNFIRNSNYDERVHVVRLVKKKADSGHVHEVGCCRGCPYDKKIGGK